MSWESRAATEHLSLFPLGDASLRVSSDDCIATQDTTIRIESKGGFELSLEITVKALLAGYTISDTIHMAGATCGNFSLQAP